MPCTFRVNNDNELYNSLLAVISPVYILCRQFCPSHTQSLSKQSQNVM